jgi:hypothetical protein
MPRRVDAYNAFEANMASKNMMNDYRWPVGHDSLNHCYFKFIALDPEYGSGINPCAGGDGPLWRAPAG